MNRPIKLQGSFVSGEPDADSRSEIDECYDSFWREIIEDEAGNVDLNALKIELYDYSRFMEEVSKVYMHVTNGRISKCNTVAEEVIAEANDVVMEAMESGANAQPVFIQVKEGVSYARNKWYRGNGGELFRFAKETVDGYIVEYNGGFRKISKDDARRL